LAAQGEAARRPRLPAEPGNSDKSPPCAAQMELLKSKEAALEKNVEQLYCAAKRRVARQDEELQELSTHKRPRTERCAPGRLSGTSPMAGAVLQPSPSNRPPRRTPNPNPNPNPGPNPNPNPEPNPNPTRQAERVSGHLRAVRPHLLTLSLTSPLPPPLTLPLPLPLPLPPPLPPTLTQARCGLTLFWLLVNCATVLLKLRSPRCALPCAGGSGGGGGGGGSSRAVRHVEVAQRLDEGTGSERPSGSTPGALRL
jgi:hypothetical protein